MQGTVLCTYVHLRDIALVKEDNNNNNDDNNNNNDGIGNRNANWLEGMRTAINSQVPAPPDENDVELDSTGAVEVLKRKKNWSAPGLDRVTNYWRKQAIALHDAVTGAFKCVMLNKYDLPLWFTGGRTTLIPKPGSFTSDNQRPITCINTIYKWFTSCLLEPMNHHLETYKLMEIEQRGAKVGCSGTMNNLLIDRMVTEDCHQQRETLAWLGWILRKHVILLTMNGWMR